MRSIPGMKVRVPCDAVETEAMIRNAVEYVGPEYIRLSREKLPLIYDRSEDIDLSSAVTLIDGSDVSIIACGIMVGEAIKAARELKKKGVSARVIDMHTVKPLDEECVVESAVETGAIVTAEESNILGGLGSAVAEVLSERKPTPMKRVGMRDVFGMSGDPYELMEVYRLTYKDIVEACMDTLKRKN